MHQLANNGEKMKVKNKYTTCKFSTASILNVNKQHGFTLIEFMVAAILGLIVLLAIGGAYVSTQRVNEVATSRVARQQELRMANNFLIRDARMAGSFGCANVFALSEMLQWLWRGCIRNKEPMNVVIGSERMYWLFMNWLNDYEISPKPIIGKTYLKGKDND